MPQTPLQNNFGVLPEVAQTPRVSAESFGAGSWKLMGENAQSMTKGAEALENTQYYNGRTAAREVLNDYRIKLDDIKDQITSNPENYREWGSQYMKLQAQLQQQFSQDERLQGNTSAVGTFKTMASDHSSQGYGDILRGQHQIEKVNNEFQLQKQSGLDAKDAVLGDDANFSKLKANIDGAGRHMGLDPANVDIRTQQLLSQAADGALNKYKDPVAGLNFIDSQNKRGVYSDDEADLRRQKYVTVDGKIAKMDGKAILDSFNNQIQKNPNFIYTTSRDSLIEQTKDAPMETQTKMLESFDKVRGGVPPTEAGRMLKAYMINENKFNDATLKAQGNTAPVDRNIVDTDSANKFQYVYQQLNNLPYEQQMDRKVQEDLVKKAETDGVYVNTQGVPETMKPYQRAFSRELLFDKNNETQLQALKQ